MSLTEKDRCKNCDLVESPNLNIGKKVVHTPSYPARATLNILPLYGSNSTPCHVRQSILCGQITGLNPAIGRSIGPSIRAPERVRIVRAGSARKLN